MTHTCRDQNHGLTELVPVWSHVLPRALVTLWLLRPHGHLFWIVDQRICPLRLILVGSRAPLCSGVCRRTHQNTGEMRSAIFSVCVAVVLGERRKRKNMQTFDTWSTEQMGYDNSFILSFCVTGTFFFPSRLFIHSLFPPLLPQISTKPPLVLFRYSFHKTGV